MVGLLLECQRQFAKPPLHTVRIDIRKVLAVHTRRALVGAAFSPGMGQYVFTPDLVVLTFVTISERSLLFDGQLANQSMRPILKELVYRDYWACRN